VILTLSDFHGVSRAEEALHDTNVYLDLRTASRERPHLRCESGIPRTASGNFKCNYLTSYKLPHTVGLANWQSD
jgi:hypothetical protein